MIYTGFMLCAGAVLFCVLSGYMRTHQGLMACTAIIVMLSTLGGTMIGLGSAEARIDRETVDLVPAP